MIQEGSELYPKPGDDVNITFISTEEHYYEWLKGENETIQIDGVRYKQEKLKNTDVVLTILNISQRSTGKYKVRCSSGEETADITVDFLGKKMFTF